MAKEETIIAVERKGEVFLSLSSSYAPREVLGLVDF